MSKSDEYQLASVAEGFAKFAKSRGEDNFKFDEVYAQICKVIASNPNAYARRPFNLTDIGCGVGTVTIASLSAYEANTAAIFGNGIKFKIRGYEPSRLLTSKADESIKKFITNDETDLERGASDFVLSSFVTPAIKEPTTLRKHLQLCASLLKPSVGRLLVITHNYTPLYAFRRSMPEDKDGIVTLNHEYFQCEMPVAINPGEEFSTHLLTLNGQHIVSLKDTYWPNWASDHQRVSIEKLADEAGLVLNKKDSKFFGDATSKSTKARPYTALVFERKKPRRTRTTNKLSKRTTRSQPAIGICP